MTVETIEPPVLPMRSKLFVPGSRPELFAKAAASPADALSFDLEDAVAPERKAQARAAVSAFLADGAAGTGAVVLVRVNGIDSGWFAEDLAAVTGPRLDVVNLPMVEEPRQVREVADRLAELETPAERGRIGLLLTIETPKGLRRAAELAGAHPRVRGLQLGYADLFEPAGIDRTDAAALSAVRLAVRLAAAEAGVPAFDAAFPGLDDPDGFREECVAARRHGFAGKSCIHPRQVAIANAAFTPSPAEVDRAERILAAAAAARRAGHGVAVVDGAMVDAPFLMRARAVVRFAAATSSGEEPEAVR